MEEIWYAYKGKPYKGLQPRFYEEINFDWAKLIENYYPIIKQELTAYIQSKNNSFQPYFNASLVKKNKSWRTSNFIFWGKMVTENCKLIPNTLNVFLQIKGLTSIGISVLESGAHIKPHHGDTNAIVRCHLGLIIPADKPMTAINVDGEIRGWKEGGLLIFCDAWNHEAWNNSDKARYLLIFDIIHPDYLAQKRSVCSNVQSWLDIQKLYEKYKFVKNSPAIIKIVLRQLLRIKYLVS
jgi:aspartyl/asparaginyl beta-hydroxylase (cupin superfamily)